MSSKISKGGKLQDKRIGPYPITKVANSSCKFIVIEKSNVSRDLRLGPGETHMELMIYLQTSILSWKLQITSSLQKNKLMHSLIQNLSPERTPVNHSCKSLNDRRTKEEILDKLSIMKDELIESLRTHTPLSHLHAELEKRLYMDYVDLFEWRLDHYPSVQNESNDITCASYEI